MTPSITPPEFAALTAGSLVLSLASGPAELEEAQRLRYRVFYEEMGAHASAETRALGLDRDEFDAYCDHLIVRDTSAPEHGVIGTYRLLRPAMRDRLGYYYTEREFDIAPMLTHEPRVVELGRSCIAHAYRRRAVMHLLWRGIAAFVELHDLHLMFGCASFHGTDPAAHRLSLSYLHHFHLAPTEYCPVALPGVRAEVDYLPIEAIDRHATFADLPALVKGYIRIGAWIGEGAVIDTQYNTTDVCIIVDRARLTQRVLQRYGKTT